MVRKIKLIFKFHFMFIIQLIFWNQELPIFEEQIDQPNRYIFNINCLYKNYLEFESIIYVFFLEKCLISFKLTTNISFHCIF